MLEHAAPGRPLPKQRMIAIDLADALGPSEVWLGGGLLAGAGLHQLTSAGRCAASATCAALSCRRAPRAVALVVPPC